MISLIIGGDIVPSFNNIEPFRLGKTEDIIDENCMKVLSDADFRVFNLETPLTDKRCPIDKEGANFAVSTESVNGLKALKIDVLGVANNHCKDQGADGLLQTINVLNQNDIRPVGYGTGFKNCESTVFLTKDGITVAIIACAETEFTVWGDGEVGAAPYHDYYTNKWIADAKQKADAVVVLYHGGKEYFTYAAPYQTERCRLMIDSGADLVLCQHSHCVSCSEEYNGGTILYGQGNFIFHQKNNLPQTKEGLLVKISVDEKNKSIEFIHTHLDQNDRACVTEDPSDFVRDFNSRNANFKKADLVAEKYCEFAKQKADAYYARLQGSNRLLRFVRRVLEKMGVKSYEKKDKLALLNLLQNESHRELFIRALKSDIEKTQEK